MNGHSIPPNNAGDTPKAERIIVREIIDGVPVKFFIYPAGARIGNHAHSFMSPATDYTWYVVGEIDTTDMTDAEFFASPLAVFEGVSWQHSAQTVGTYHETLNDVRNTARRDIARRMPGNPLLSADELAIIAAVRSGDWTASLKAVVETLDKQPEHAESADAFRARWDAIKQREAEKYTPAPAPAPLDDSEENTPFAHEALAGAIVGMLILNLWIPRTVLHDRKSLSIIDLFNDVNAEIVRVMPQLDKDELSRAGTLAE